MSIHQSESSRVAKIEKTMRSTAAAMMPKSTARERWWAGSPAAAKPITTALSPDRMMLSQMISARPDSMPLYASIEVPPGSCVMTG
jgi:hypothetical protein